MSLQHRNSYWFSGISRGADSFHTISRRWHNQPLGVGASSTEIRDRHAKSQRALLFYDLGVTHVYIRAIATNMSSKQARAIGVLMEASLQNFHEVSFIPTAS